MMREICLPFPVPIPLHFFCLHVMLQYTGMHNCPYIITSTCPRNLTVVASMSVKVIYILQIRAKQKTVFSALVSF